MSCTFYTSFNAMRNGFLDLLIGHLPQKTLACMLGDLL
jgi:hypothetical protein